MKPARMALEEIRSGAYGQLLRVRARPKDDSRGGGKELLLHGTHLFDLMIALAGRPRWASAHVTVKGQEATKEDATRTQPVGPILGDSISTMFGFDHGFVDISTPRAGLAEPGRTEYKKLYGLSVECERALLDFREPGDLFRYPGPRVLPDLREFEWEKVWVEDWHGAPERDPSVFGKKWLAFGNQILARDLIDAVEQDREPLSSVSSVRFVNEMVEGVYRSHLSGGIRVTIPLEDRSHPL